MNYQREYERITDGVGTIRNITILLIVCVVCSVGGFIFIPGIIPDMTKIYIISVFGGFVIFFLISLIVARKDTYAVLFFMGLAQFFAGILLGTAIISVQEIIHQN